MADNTTKPTDISPESFVKSIEHDVRRADAEALLSLFSDVTGLKPKMWGPTIIGYGRYHYKYDSGREGDAILTGFSPRKTNQSIYIMPGYQFGKMEDMLSRLGKHKLGKSCLYINKLSDVDTDVLREIIASGVAYMRENYETWNE
jgi:hypothetical protein